MSSTPNDPRLRMLAEELYMDIFAAEAQIEGTAATVARQTAMIEAALDAAEQRGREQAAQQVEQLRRPDPTCLYEKHQWHYGFNTAINKALAALRAAPDPTNTEPPP